MERYQSAVLQEVRPLARDTFLYVLSVATPIAFEPGQFVNIAIPKSGPRGERSYSVWSDPASSQLEFAIKLFPGGQASEYLRSVRPGTPFSIRGPFGHFQLCADEPEVGQPKVGQPEVGQPEVGQAAHWFLATSTGLAPFHSMLSAAARTGDPRRFRLLFGCRDEADIFAVERLEYFKLALDFAYTICLSGPNPGPNYAAGRITAHLPTPTSGDHYYLCGNGMMIAEAREKLKATGLDRKRNHFEKYW